MALKTRCSEFRVAPAERVDLRRRPTQVARMYRSKQDYAALLGRHIAELSRMQELLYAADRESLLLIFQAMDAAGKDGAIKHVMSGVNPQGCQVFSFKHPSAEDLDHDFLWRTSNCLPERGRIGIFNRSYYEEVLIVRVHPEILAGERLPPSTLTAPQFWKARFRSITELEAHLHRNGTRIVKFFLHLSREEQRKRLLARIDKPRKNWKFSLADVQERARWHQYMKAYEDCLGATSSADSPWYIVPADDKKNARLIISGIVVETLRGLSLAYPTVSKARRAELLKMRRLLAR
jgi:PPK2 family polyphosphate:nucleotide phosphotransferase